MKKSYTGVIVGLILIYLGIMYALKAFGIVSASILFKGWWTLFIIVPSIRGLVSKRGNRTWSILGIVVGVALLFNSWGSNFNVFSLIVAALLLIIGLRMFGGKEAIKKIIRKKDEFFGYDNYDSCQDINDTEEARAKAREGFAESYEKYGSSVNGNDNSTDKSTDSSYDNSYDGSYDNSYDSGYDARNYDYSYNSYENYDLNKRPYNESALNILNILGGRTVKMDGEIFYGANVVCVLGGVEIHLEHAIIDRDVQIDVTTVLGGVDIYLPKNVRTVTNCTPFMGGVDDHTRTPEYVDENTPTIYINGAAILGGVDIAARNSQGRDDLNVSG